MSAVIAPPVHGTPTDETLDAVLAPTHDAWVEEARQLLMPPTAPNAPWERWPVIRWLNDRFVHRFQVERALLNELRPLLTVREEQMLDAGEERIVRLRLGLDRIVRRRGSVAEFRVLAEEFLRSLEMWCAETELVAQRIRFRSLTLDARRAMDELETASDMMLRL